MLLDPRKFCKQCNATQLWTLISIQSPVKSYNCIHGAVSRRIFNGEMRCVKENNNRYRIRERESIKRKKVLIGNEILLLQAILLCCISRNIYNCCKSEIRRELKYIRI